VIGNLLTNAIRYGRGRPIELRVIKKSEMAIISVKDQGYGIAAEDLRRIFDRFERAIHYTEVSGMGLGLFISKEIIEAHRGQIWVESELDKGSTFYVSIPL
jgi:signal transduction histidine kinase